MEIIVLIDQKDPLLRIKMLNKRNWRNILWKNMKLESKR